MASTVEQRISAEFAPYIAQQLDEHWEELIDDMNLAERAGSKIFHVKRRVLDEIPLLTEMAAAAYLAARGDMTIRQLAELQFPEKA